MKFAHKLISAAVLSLVGFGLLAVTGVGSNKASAAANCVPYDPNSSISTPVFNNFCGVPQGIGDEPDFVRVRKSTNGNPTDNANNPVFTDTVNDVCSANAKFDVRTYIHNNAASGFNASGSAIAHNVMLNMQAPLNKVQKNFVFNSTISASNAASVSDTGTLNCSNGKQIKLKLVPSSVHAYSKVYGGWKDLADGSVNSTIKLGSPDLGSGDVYGCWDYRIVVVYQVQVEEIAPPDSSALCKLSNFEVMDNRTVRMTVSPSLVNATVLAYEINWGDGSKSTKQTDTHTYAKDGNYTITARVQVKLNDGTVKWVDGAECTKKVVFQNNNPMCPIPGKEHLPVDSPECKEVPPIILPDTGPGNILGVFIGTSIIGAVLHKLYMVRKAIRL